MTISILIVSAGSLVCSIWSLVKVHDIGLKLTQIASQKKAYYIVDSESVNVAQVAENDAVHVDLDEAVEYAREQAAKRGQWYI